MVKEPHWDHELDELEHPLDSEELIVDDFDDEDEPYYDEEDFINYLDDDYYGDG